MATQTLTFGDLTELRTPRDRLQTATARRDTGDRAVARELAARINDRLGI